MTKSSNSLINPFSDAFDFSSRLAKGFEAFGNIDDDQVDVGATQKELVAQFDKVKLYRYKPLTKPASGLDPVLIVYGLIGRYTMIDLQEDRSLVRNLLKRGIDVYVVDWGYPSRADQFLSFDDYVGIYLDDCVTQTLENSAYKQLTLFGVCEGGVFTTMYATHKPELVSKLIVSITPIDFAAYRQDEDMSHGLINLWLESMPADDLNDLIDAYGNLPGEIMGAMFQAITPIKSMTKYNLDLLDVFSDEDKVINFMRMEKWLADRPHHPGEAAKQWLIDLYKENKLVKGEFELMGEKLDLANISMPILNLYAERDHIIPPPCSQGLKQYVSSQDYTELPIKGGHVGIYVSSKLQDIVGDGISNWLNSRKITTEQEVNDAK
jgi:polyhydroxyalkanoate synthase